MVLKKLESDVSLSKAKHAGQRQKSSSACAPGISVISPREALDRTPEEATGVPEDWREEPG